MAKGTKGFELPCSVEGCERLVGKSGARGFCPTHYSRWWRTGDPGAALCPHQPAVCSVEGCGRDRRSANGLCLMHYKRWKRWGDPLGARPPRSKCSVEACGRVATSRGMCGTHYSRWRSHGDALAVVRPVPPRLPERRFNLALGQAQWGTTARRPAAALALAQRGLSVEDRLWPRIDKAGPVHPRLQTKCWLWQGPLDGEGYGNLHIGGKHKRVHRLVYELLVGPIPKGLVIDHLCQIRHCVNPKHLEAVTIAENGRRASKERHCWNCGAALSRRAAAVGIPT